MEIREALKKLGDFLEEVTYLKTLSHDNQEYPRWKNKVKAVLQAAFTKNSDEYKDFTWVGGLIGWLGMTEADRQELYLRDLKRDELEIMKILDRYEVIGIADTEKTTMVTQLPRKKSIESTKKPKAFIAHGGKSPALTKLCDFLTALGIKPLVVEDEPSQGRSVGEQVKWCLDQSDCAIVLATKGDIDGNTGEFLPRGNVLNEIGRFQEKFSSRIVYLIESGTKFPSNINEKVREHFKTQSMDKAFIKVAKELTVFGLIKALKPE